MAQTQQQNYQYFEQDTENQQQKGGLVGTQVRLGFIKKVYSILFVQFGLTFLLCMLSMTSKSFLVFQLTTPALLYLSFFLVLVTIVALACCGYHNKVPTNYILLFIFTICESYMISMVCGVAPPKLVAAAAFMTFGMFFALTLYACTTKTDFTTSGALLSVCLMAFVFAGIIFMFIDSNIGHIVMDVIGIVLFSFYIIYDTQMIMGGNHKNQHDVDTYILASIDLYLDVVNIFLMLLDLFQRTE